MQTYIFNKKSENFNIVRWVALAVSKNPRYSRPVLSYINVEKDGSMVATDGHRLHKAKLAEETLEPGLYEVLKVTKSEVLLGLSTDKDFYPQYEHLIPDVSDSSIYHNIWEKRRSILIDRVYTDLVRIMHAQKTLNYEYVKELLDFEGREPGLYVSAQLSGKVIVKGEDLTALLMPIQIKDL